MKKIGIIDYGMGNLRSVEKALQKCGVKTQIVQTPDAVLSMEKLVFPGVGAFGDAVENLRQWNLWNPIAEFIASQRPFLGICLGMQLLLERSFEKGVHQGFSVFRGEVRRFPENVKVPQIGWNQVEFKNPSCPLWEKIEDRTYFYFVHSYYTAVAETSEVAAMTFHGLEYACAVQKGNVFGVQFHPEKSQNAGLQLLQNFILL